MVIVGSFNRHAGKRNRRAVLDGDLGAIDRWTSTDQDLSVGNGNRSRSRKVDDIGRNATRLPARRVLQPRCNVDFTTLTAAGTRANRIRAVGSACSDDVGYS